MGLDGPACVQRLLCEVAAKPLKDLGLAGDIINLILRYFSDDTILIFLLIVIS